MALLAVRDAVLVDGGGARPGGVLVGADGRIEAVVAAADRPAAEVAVDARGRLLFPGFVDAHVHMRDPGFPHKETFATGSGQAACGGVTTVMCMPNTNPPVEGAAAVAAARAAGEGASLVDFTIQGAAAPGTLDRLEALWAEGVTSLEGLMSDAPPGEALDPGPLREAARRVAGFGGVLGVMAGDRALVEAARARLAGRGDYMAFVEARGPEGEANGLAVLLDAARATGARIVARQVSTARGLAAVAAARAADPALAVAVEVTPHHLHLDAGAVARHGPHALMVPPLRAPADRDAARAALASGAVDFVASDHAPHAPGEKDRRSPWEVPGGAPGLATLAPAVLDRAASGRISWPRAAELLSARPARLFGLADRKGRLAPGADGDLVLVDPGLARVVGPPAAPARARSPFEGMRLAGWPVLTVLGGVVVAESGALAGGPPRGRWLRRGAPVWG